MYNFIYHKPATLDAALENFAAADDGQFMAGGQTMIPVLKQRLAMPSTLVDLNKVEGLSGITTKGDVIEIGASDFNAMYFRLDYFD